jgi:predicted Zn-dependent protease
MYCRQDGIAGFGEERERARTLLARYLDGKPGIVLLPLEDPDWVYGQASFCLEEGAPFKFVDRFTTVARNNVLESLAVEGRPAAILFSDAALKQRFEGHQAFVCLKPLFRLVNEFVKEEGGNSVFRRIRNFFSHQVEPAAPLDGKTVARNAVQLFSERIGTEEGLSEVFLGLFLLYHYCSLDTARTVLEARIANRPDDPVGVTALAWLLSGFGDHPAALDCARRACALPNPPPEALLCHAMQAWWAEEAEEGLQALARIGPAPAHWSLRVQCGVHTVEGALLALRGKHEGAAHALQQAIEIDGRGLALHLCLTAELALSGQPGEARAALDTAAVLAPDDPIVQVELCRHLQAQGQANSLNRALRKLCRTERGRFEARRFAESESIEGSDKPVPDQFPEIDRDRRHTLTASTFPTWFQLCDDSPFATFLDIHVDDCLRPPDSLAALLSKCAYLLRSRPLESKVHAAAMSAWQIADRVDVAATWGRAALALEPSDESIHRLYAFVLRDGGDLEQAYEVVVRAIALGKVSEQTKELYSWLFWTIPKIDVMIDWAYMPDQREVLRKAARTRLDDPQTRAAGLVALSVLELAVRSRDALNLIDQALELEPDRDDFHELKLVIVGALAPELAESALEQRATALRRRHPAFGAENWAAVTLGLLAAERYQTAEAWVRAGLQEAPDSVAVRVAEAKVLLALGRRQQALDALRPLAFGSSPCSEEAAGLLGDELTADGRYEEALAVWRLVQERAPDSAAGFLGAGIDCWLLDRDAEAADLVERAVQLDDANAYAWGLYGRILAALGEPVRALAALERALAFEQPPARALRALTDILVSMDRAGEAATRCRTVLAAQPENAEAAAALAKALAAVDAGEALRFVLEWIGERARDADAVVALRAALAASLGPSAVLRVGEAALAKYPDHAQLLVAQAASLSALGRFAEARALAARALETEPANRDALWEYANASAYASGLDPSEARELAERLTALPGASTLRLAADVLRAAGLDARPAYQRALDFIEAQAASEEHVAAWCLLHLGRTREALARMERYEAPAWAADAAAFDRAVIGFLAHDGMEGWSGKLAAAIRAANESDRGAGYLAQLRALVPQWLHQAIVPAATLEALSRVADEAVRRFEPA